MKGAGVASLRHFYNSKAMKITDVTIGRYLKKKVTIKKAPHFYPMPSYNIFSYTSYFLCINRKVILIYYSIYLLEKSRGSKGGGWHV
jgi:hypothetical protein